MTACWQWGSGLAQGVSHRQDGLPCQDRVLAMPVGDQGVVLAAIDGAGSASHAEAGAEAVQWALECCVNRTTVCSAQMLESWMHAANAALSLRAQELQVPGHALACTVVVSALGPWGMCAAQVGDGVAIYDDGSGWRPLTWPMNGTYANQTWFVDGDSLEGRLMVLSRTEQPLRAMVMSDGLVHLALRHATQEAYAPFLNPVWSVITGCESPHRGLHRVLHSRQIQGATDDDLSIAVAWRAGD